MLQALANYKHGHNTVCVCAGEFVHMLAYLRTPKLSKRVRLGGRLSGALVISERMHQPTRAPA